MSESQAAQSADSRSKKIVKVSATGIVVNAVLALVKIIIGTLIGAVAVTVDGLNNFVDALSSVVTIIGSKAAVKAPNKKHPYGYGRVEYVSSLIIGMLILYTAVSTFTDSFNKVIHPEAAGYTSYVLIIIAGTIGVKILLSAYFKKSGKKINSDALWASGVDALTDAAVSSTILIGGAVEIFAHVSIDGWLGMFISIMIAKSAIDVLKISISRMVGERIPRELSKQLKSEIANHEGVLGVFDLILNRYGTELTIGSVHIEIDGDKKATEIDTLCRKIVGHMYNHHGIIMTVGIYAYDRNSPEADAIRRTVRTLSQEFPDILQIHGFYADEKAKTMSFDVVIDFRCEDPERVLSELKQKVNEKYPDYTIFMVRDADFAD